MAKRPNTIPAVRPNLGLQIAYARKINALTDEMHDSVLWWVRAAYRQEEARITLALDASPAKELADAIKKLSRRWQKKFDDASIPLADYFAQNVATRSDRQLKSILRKAGLSVKFELTRAQRDMIDATVQANVGLIKNIPQKYFTQVEGAVMRSVQTGRDLKQLTDDLEGLGGITRSRAKFIARDQNNKATGALNRTRQLELGIREAIWVHSHGDREPRKSHAAAGARKQRYRIDEGWYDPDARGKGKGEYIIPGQLINCTCVSRSIIPGLDD